MVSKAADKSKSVSAVTFPGSISSVSPSPKERYR
jgi:hypothetical protein